MKLHRLVPLLVLTVALATACNQSETARVQSKDGGHSILFRDGSLVLDADGLPSATITASGDLLIDGKAVTLTDAQRQLALDYRSQLGAIAQQGVEIGKQGGLLGVQAAGDALKGVLSGDTNKIGEKVEAQADRIKEQALKICDHLDRLKAAQDALAVQVPAFKPYAHLDTDSATDCRNG
ncbi:DUF2884 family protein [[Pseudomonas] boreopolis]|uniref:DUF2884 family protein n=1 Tax=Xanthomonas boreopolis TaxID=86183 RepID=UPI003DA03B02